MKKRLRKKIRIETKQKNYLKIFQTYTQRSLAEIICAGLDPRKLRIKQQERAVLFSDIRNFTLLSEHLDPVELVAILNDFFNRINQVVYQNSGEVDKLMGDCVMATFSDSNQAVEAAIEIKLSIQEMNRQRLAQGLEKIENGVGVSYGTVTVGNVGSALKMDYTLVGEVVNTAARLESLTKHYGVGILVSESVREHLQEGFKNRFIDLVRLGGKGEPLKVYEIFNHEPEMVKAKKFSLNEPFSEAFDFYREGNFNQAEGIYDYLIEEVGPHCYVRTCCADPVLEFYKDRCSGLERRLRQGLLSVSNWQPVQEFSQI